MRAFDRGRSAWTSADLRAATRTVCTHQICLPSGLTPKPSTSGMPSPLPLPVICSGCEPSAFMRHTCIEPLRSERNHTLAPSADHWGAALLDA